MSHNTLSKQSEAALMLLSQIDKSFCYPLSAENNVSGYTANGYYVQAKYALHQFFDCIANCTEQETELSLFGLMLRFVKLAYETPDSSHQMRIRIARMAVSVLDSSDNLENAKDIAGEIVSMICTMREPLATQLPALVVKAKRVVDRYYADPNFNISMLGEKLGVSGYYASKKFKKCMGVSLSDYICRVRVEKAKSFMLDSRLSLDSVAARVGLNDSRALNIVFKRIAGMSPSAYRALIKQ